MKVLRGILGMLILASMTSSCTYKVIQEPNADWYGWAATVDTWMARVHDQLDNEQGNLGEIRSAICDLYKNAAPADPAHPLTIPGFCSHPENDDLEDPPCPITNPACSRAGGH